MQNTALPIALTGYDWENDHLYFTMQTGPIHGTLTDSGPNRTYMPAVNYVGHDSFTFSVDDGKYSSGAATASINVVPPFPTFTTANADFLEVAQGSTGNVLDVLANDVDSDGNALTITAPASTLTTAHGTVTPSPDATSLTFSLTDPNFFGTESFSYTISNGHGRSALGNVTVFVNGTGNVDPAWDEYVVMLNLPRGIRTATIDIGSDLLPHFSDAGDTPALYSVGMPELGTAVNDGLGHINYTRTPGKYGPDPFSYVITDGKGGYETGTFVIDQVDTDGDGLPDDWEIAQGGAAQGYDPDSSTDPWLDIDGDGLPTMTDDYDLLPQYINAYDCCAYRQRDTPKSKETLLKTLEEGDNFFWFGHANAAELHCSGTGKPCFPTVPCVSFIDARDVAKHLGNDASRSMPTHLYRLVMLRGCFTYSKEWADSFGIHPFTDLPAGNTDSRPMTKLTVAEFAAIGRQPRAFIGWVDKASHPCDIYEWDAFFEAYSVFFDNWMAGETLSVCLRRFDYSVINQNNQDYGVSGCIDLRRLNYD